MANGAEGRDENPFMVPPDEQIFQLRDLQRQTQAEARAHALNASVADKKTFAFQMQATSSKDCIQRRDLMDSALKRDGGTGNTAAPGALVDRRGRDHESLTDMLAKKREIFLVQMALDTKRAEIRKLEERVLQREEALKQSEAMLEADARAFDAFIKDNDDKVKEAEKKAEVEKSKKQERVNDIKRLTQEIAQHKSEFSKYEEQLRDCQKYQQFLDRITPSEWFEEQEQKAQREQEKLIAAWKEECENVRKTKADAQIAKTQAEQAYQVAKTQQEAEKAEKMIKETNQALKDAMKLVEPPKPDFKAEQQPKKLAYSTNLLEKHTHQTVDSSHTQAHTQANTQAQTQGSTQASTKGQAAEEPPLYGSSAGSEDMYFERPEQLLNIFKELEEQALFLIQNAQESEEGLEEVRLKYKETKQRMESEVYDLKQQIVTLEAAISIEEQKAAALRERVAQNSNSISGMGGAGGVSLQSLTEKVAEIYELAGFELDPSIAEQPVSMLTNLESKLEEYLSITELLPQDIVESAEKSREKERRQVAREAKLSIQRNEHEARLKRALERAAAPVYRKQGKPVMWRSVPVRKKEVVTDNVGNNDDLELDMFLQKDMLA